MTAPFSTKFRSPPGGFSLLELLLLVALCGLLVALWTGCVQTFGGADTLTDLAISHDGRRLAAAYQDGSVVVWNTDARKSVAHVDSAFAWRSNGDVALSPDGRFVACASDADIAVQVWDLHRGERVAILPWSDYSSFSPDGKWLAVGGFSRDGLDLYGVGEWAVQKTIYPPSLEAVFSPDGKTLATFSGTDVLLHDLGGEAPSRRIDSPCAPLSWPAPDALVLSWLGVDPATIEVWDPVSPRRVSRYETSDYLWSVWLLDDGELLALVADELVILSMPDLDPVRRVPLNRATQVAASPTSPILAVDDYDFIRLVDVSSGRTVGQLKRGGLLPVWIPIVGLILWFSVWRVVRALRRTRKCSDCGAVFVPKKRRDVDGRCFDCRLKDLTQEQIRKRRRRAMYPLAIWLVAFVAAEVWVRSNAWGAWFAALSVVLLAAVALGYLVWSLGVWVPRVGPLGQAADFALARRCADNDGQTRQARGVSLWTDDERFAEELPRLLEETESRYARLVGRKVSFPPKLRVLAFTRSHAFHAYLCRYGVPSGVLGAVAFGIPLRKVVACRQACLELLTSPDEAIQTSLSAFLMLADKGFLPRLWLDEGPGQLVAVVDDPEALARLRRQARAAMAMDEALSLKALLNFGLIWNIRKYFDPYDFDAFRFRTLQNVQAFSLLDYLAGPDTPAPRAERFRNFYHQFRKRENPIAALTRHFECDPQSLWNDWRAWALRWGDVPPGPAPEALRESIESQILPLIRNADAPLQERVRAIRILGTAGYQTGAEALVDCLSEEAADLGRESHFALRLLSGRTFDADPDAWRAWLAEVGADPLKTGVGS